MESLSIYRSECKYLVNKIERSKIENELDKILKRDSNSVNNSYIVRSLYFDSINNIDFSTKLSGIEIRKKIRIRTYNPKSDKCKLEIKQKNGEYQHKISIWITKNDAIELINMNYYVLTKYFDNPDAVLIYKEMSLGCYKPAVMVEYDRIAYVNDLYNTRLTLDMNLRYSESCFDLFKDEIIYDKLNYDFTILEVKFNGSLLEYIKKTLKKFYLTQLSVSKYCICRYNYYNFNF